jgi:HAE1 family hydrophobic/amphiphilic exporter-1
MIKMLMFAGQKPITIEIAGEDLKQGMKLAHKIEDVVKSVKGTRDVTVSMDNPKIELTVRLKRRLAQEKGLNPAIVGKILRTYFYGMKVSKFHEQGEEFDIFLRLGKNLKNDINTLKSISVENLKGEKIRLDEIADINFEAVPEQIERKDRERIIKVEANLNNRALSAIISDIKEKMKKIGIPEGFSVKFAGDVENQKESFRNLIMLLIVGILLVYMVMAGQFESLKMPFIIMFSIPFTFTGVIISFLITGTTLSVNSFLGIIILMGIVVNNAIVLIDYINLMRKRGMNLKEAVILTGQRRLRPILITTFTTILGMLPMALTNGPSSEVYNPLGITVIGGLSVSTLVTLLIIPCIYYVIERKKAEV